MLEGTVGLDLFANDLAVARLASTYRTSGDTNIFGNWVKLAIPLH